VTEIKFCYITNYKCSNKKTPKGNHLWSNCRLAGYILLDKSDVYIIWGKMNFFIIQIFYKRTSVTSSTSFLYSKFLFQQHTTGYLLFLLQIVYIVRVETPVHKKSSFIKKQVIS